MRASAVIAIVYSIILIVMMLVRPDFDIPKTPPAVMDDNYLPHDEEILKAKIGLSGQSSIIFPGLMGRMDDANAHYPSALEAYTNIESMLNGKQKYDPDQIKEEYENLERSVEYIFDLVGDHNKRVFDTRAQFYWFAGLGLLAGILALTGIRVGGGIAAILAGSIPYLYKFLFLGPLIFSAVFFIFGGFWIFQAIRIRQRSKKNKNEDTDLKDLTTEATEEETNESESVG